MRLTGRVFWRRRRHGKPDFPLNGAMMRAAGLTDGPEMGEMARALEQWWVAAGFPDRRGQGRIGAPHGRPGLSCFTALFQAKPQLAAWTTNALNIAAGFQRTWCRDHRAS